MACHAGYNCSTVVCVWWGGGVSANERKMGQQPVQEACTCCAQPWVGDGQSPGDMCGGRRREAASPARRARARARLSAFPLSTSGATGSTGATPSLASCDEARGCGDVAAWAASAAVESPAQVRSARALTNPTTSCASAFGEASDAREVVGLGCIMSARIAAHRAQWHLIADSGHSPGHTSAALLCSVPGPRRHVAHPIAPALSQAAGPCTSANWYTDCWLTPGAGAAAGDCPAAERPGRGRDLRPHRCLGQGRGGAPRRGG